MRSSPGCPTAAAAARRPYGRGSAGLEAPAARGVPLDHRRAQAERFGRHAADPKLYAGDVDCDEYGARSIRPGRKKGIISGRPAPADLGLALGKAGFPGERDKGVVGIVLEDDGGVADTAHV